MSPVVEEQAVAADRHLRGFLRVRQANREFGAEDIATVEAFGGGQLAEYGGGGGHTDRAAIRRDVQFVVAGPSANQTREPAILRSHVTVGVEWEASVAVDVDQELAGTRIRAGAAGS